MTDENGPARSKIMEYVSKTLDLYEAGFEFLADRDSDDPRNKFFKAYEAYIKALNDLPGILRESAEISDSTDTRIMEANSAFRADVFFRLERDLYDVFEISKRFSDDRPMDEKRKEFYAAPEWWAAASQEQRQDVLALETDKSFIGLSNMYPDILERFFVFVTKEAQKEPFEALDREMQARILRVAIEDLDKTLIERRAIMESSRRNPDSIVRHDFKDRDPEPGPDC